MKAGKISKGDFVCLPKHGWRKALSVRPDTLYTEPSSVAIRFEGLEGLYVFRVQHEIPVTHELPFWEALVKALPAAPFGCRLREVAENRREN